MRHYGAKFRVFIDLGSQASFVSSELVRAVKPRKVGTRMLSMRSFDSSEVAAEYGLFELTITGLEGRVHTVRAYEKPALNLHIEWVPEGQLALWKSQGVALSDQSCVGVPGEPHVLFGATTLATSTSQHYVFLPCNQLHLRWEKKVETLEGSQSQVCLFFQVQCASFCCGIIKNWVTAPIFFSNVAVV